MIRLKMSDVRQYEKERKIEKLMWWNKQEECERQRHKEKETGSKSDVYSG